MTTSLHLSTARWSFLPLPGDVAFTLRVPYSLGIAVVGTALFGSGEGEDGSAKVTPSLVHTSQAANWPGYSDAAEGSGQG
jgi:hypothetical protein